jgi:hypothetical protein
MVKRGNKHVLRCTKYLHGGNGENSGWATKKHPIWFYDAEYVGTSEYSHMCERMLKGPGLPSAVLVPDGEDCSLMNYDDYAVVPDDEVPDWLYAEVARRALMGER